MYWQWFLFNVIKLPPNSIIPQLIITLMCYNILLIEEITCLIIPVVLL